MGPHWKRCWFHRGLGPLTIICRAQTILPPTLAPIKIESIISSKGRRRSLDFREAFNILAKSPFPAWDAQELQASVMFCGQIKLCQGAEASIEGKSTKRKVSTERVIRFPYPTCSWHPDTSCIIYASWGIRLGGKWALRAKAPKGRQAQREASKVRRASTKRAGRDHTDTGSAGGD